MDTPFTREELKKFEQSREFKEIIEKCKKQDPEALEKFFEIYSVEIYNFPVKTYRLPEEEAGDFFLYAFERLREGKRFRTFRGEATFRTWFYSVLRNLFLDWLRYNKKFSYIRYVPLDFYDGKEMPVFKDEYEYQEMLRILEEEIASLEPLERVIFKLVYLFYLDIEEPEIRYLKDNFHKDNGEIVAFVQDMKEYLMHKNYRFMEKMNRLGRFYLKVKSLQEREDTLSKNKTEHTDAEREEIQEKIRKRNASREKLLSEIQTRGMTLKIPFHRVARFLHLSVPTVSLVFKKAEEKIKTSQRLRNFLHT